MATKKKLKPVRRASTSKALPLSQVVSALNNIERSLASIDKALHARVAGQKANSEVVDKVAKLMESIASSMLPPPPVVGQMDIGTGAPPLEDPPSVKEKKPRRAKQTVTLIPATAPAPAPEPEELE